MEDIALLTILGIAVIGLTCSNGLMVGFALTFMIILCLWKWS